MQLRTQVIHTCLRTLLLKKTEFIRTEQPKDLDE